MSNVSLSKEAPEARALALVPENVAKRLSIMPLCINGNGELVVAAADPANALIHDELIVLTGKDVEIVFASPSEIVAAISRHYKIAASLRDAMFDFSLSRAAQSSGGVALGEATELTPDAPPIVRLFGEILDHAVVELASDVHVEPYEDCTVVRLRVDGKLHEILQISPALHPALTTRIKIQSGMDISEKRKPQDGRALITHQGRRIDMRTSSVPSVFGEKLALRLLDQGREETDIGKLGFDGAQRELLIAAGMENGIFLITGPTGSGKSTTLYALLKLMNKPDINIITIEDPVEYTIRGITQIQINEKSGVTFPAVLRSVLRQDPDKLMIGEIRDGETAELAVRAALTGHTVLSTLHTNDAVSTVSRLIDIGIPAFLLASSLRGVLAQRLVRKLCPLCKKKATLAPSLNNIFALSPNSGVYEAVGCVDCRYTGFKGRTVVAEILKVDDGLREMIARNSHAGEYIEYAVSKGMKTMRQAALEKVLGGMTTVAEALYGSYAD